MGRFCHALQLSAATADEGRSKAMATEAERRKSVEAAIANSRIDGFPPPSGVELEIWEAYIRGEIKAEDLVNVVKKRLLQS